VFVSIITELRLLQSQVKLMGVDLQDLRKHGSDKLEEILKEAQRNARMLENTETERKHDRDRHKD
jgi:uncharacterized membrane-anchored protein YhcB (DUF1043 family)